jgi:hypothetical protein
MKQPWLDGILDSATIARDCPAHGPRFQPQPRGRPRGKRGRCVGLHRFRYRLGGAYFISRALQTMLYGVGAMDFVAFASVGLILLLAALLACYLPARRRRIGESYGRAPRGVEDDWDPSSIESKDKSFGGVRDVDKR